MRIFATGTAKAPATCGELIQGNIDGTDFLVTCPVSLFSTVTVNLYPAGKIICSLQLPKIRLAVHKTLCFFNKQHLGAEIKIESRIPQGKGMASSTADIAAACAATAAALGATLTPMEIARIALSIEPTDGLMFPGIVMFDHIQGKLVRELGPSPKLDVLMVDLGGMVDTLAFNNDEKLAYSNLKKEWNVRQALVKLERALHIRDLSLLGEAATESAFAHQEILHKPQLNSLLDICIEFGGIGINIAHSGTIVGLLFEPDQIDIIRLTKTLKSKGFNYFSKTELIDGGILILQEGDGETSWIPLTTPMAEICGQQQKNMI